ncbi:MBL fold metallo-hydrolase [Vibrio sp. RC27]
MKNVDVCQLDRRTFIKSAAIGAVTISATSAGLLGSMNEANAAPPKPKLHNHTHSFSVVTVGTGNPIPDKNRASSCTMIQFNNKYYLLDTGNGVNDVMDQHGFAHNKISAILFTHLHADHTTDFIDLMINRWMTGGKEMSIMGPPRCGGYYNFMLDFFADDLTYRQYRGYKGGITELGMFTGIDVTELKGRNNFELDGMQVRTEALTHTMYNLGYRFDVDGKSIVVSGDTSFDPKLIELAKGADVLVIDANITTVTAQKGADEQTFTDENIVKPKPKYEYAGNFDVAPHMGIDDVAKTATEAQVKTVVLTHLPPAPFNIDTIQPYFDKAGFKGQVLEATDGLEINP